jgi:hypothetical protein
MSRQLTHTDADRAAGGPDAHADAVREKAAAIVAGITDRLAPDHMPDAPAGPGWKPLGLAQGLAALALPSAVLARGGLDRHHAAHVRTRLRQAAAHRRPAAESLYLGAPALAFTARVARGSGADYTRLLRSLDQQTARVAVALCARDRPRLEQGIPAVPLADYDVISGLSGLGRYLLAAPEEHHRALDEVLRHLARLVLPLRLEGRQIPGWWTRDAGNHPPYRAGAGHADLGMAHGIGGPLALLSLAWSQGHRVPGQDEALDLVGSWLVERCLRDDAGPYWARTVDLPTLASATMPTGRAPGGWCYGAGTAAALRLAAHALHRSDWLRLAYQALDAVVRTADPGRGGPGLCHGSAGLLTIAATVARQDGVPTLKAAADDLATRICASADPCRPFLVGDDPGFLDGAAGVALALETWLGGPDRAAAPSSAPLSWRGALLLD